MILNRRKIKHTSQEEVGYDLGLIVPKKEAHFFTKVRISKKPVAGYGTQASKKKYSINHYFLKNKINLKEKYYPAEKIKNIKKFIKKNLKNDNDIVACFNNKILYGKGDYGHVSLIETINAETATLAEPQNAKRKRVILPKLIKAMIYHGRNKNRGGFWVISEK